MVEATLFGRCRFLGADFWGEFLVFYPLSDFERPIAGRQANVVDGFDALPLSIRISEEEEEEDYGPEDGEIIDVDWTTVTATENIGDINPFSRDSSR